MFGGVAMISMVVSTTGGSKMVNEKTLSATILSGGSLPSVSWILSFLTVTVQTSPSANKPSVSRIHVVGPVPPVARTAVRKPEVTQLMVNQLESACPSICTGSLNVSVISESLSTPVSALAGSVVTTLGGASVEKVHTLF